MSAPSQCDNENQQDYATLYDEQAEYRLMLCQLIQTYDSVLAMQVAAEFGIVDDFRRQQ